ncbi:MAG: RelA/SpoT family protein [Prevotellaceae bacterium]|jgi:GTP pyrophosphokinase|nr:RelA/SpoT family protein [Prevotellaceae bacterium]
MISPFFTEPERHEIKEQLDMLLQAANCSSDGKVKIRKAFDFANNAHMGVRRKMGEPYIFHPLAVAYIVAKEMNMDEYAVCAALLHDVVEDTECTIEEIDYSFGDRVAEMVQGLTKITGAFGIAQSKQAVNFKKILMTINTDVNTAMIKIADRLHNMRTLDPMSERKQFQIASETLILFAPLAERFGLYSIKTELEDLCLKYYEPEKYMEIKELIGKKELESENFIRDFEEPIEKKLNEAEIEFHISSRFKSVYSIWRKMQKKNIPFEEVYDLFAIRIVFKPKNGIPERTQCWAIYSLITEIYRAKLDRLRDWVGTPKANGYEALHCTLMGPKGLWIEVQIRTERMDEIAEKGIAVHRKYKETNIDEWLKKIRDSLTKYDVSAEEFVLDVIDTLVPEIYVYTPKGQELVLPKGATVLDFAYFIHTEIGNHAVAGKVNYKLVPLNHVLSSTDQVEIVTTKNQIPQKEWIDYAATQKAKALIKTALRSLIKEHSKKGKGIIDRKLTELGILPNSRTYRKLIEAYGQNNKEELFSNVGAGILDLEGFNKILRENTPKKWVQYLGIQFIQLGLNGITRKKPSEPSEPSQNSKIDTKQIYFLKENGNLEYHIAECCNPIPGDEIIAFIDDNAVSVTVHKKKCAKALHIAAQHAEKIVGAKWGSHKALSFLAVLEIRGIDRLGLLKDLTEVITMQLNVNIRKVNVASHDGIFEGYIELYVHDLDDLKNLIKKVQNIKGVEVVKRIENHTEI